MRKVMSCLFAMLLAMTLTIAGCGGGGGGSNGGGGGGGEDTTPICSFGSDKLVVIYTDYAIIASLTQDSKGVITGTAYEHGFNQNITGTVYASEYHLFFNSIENGKTYGINISGSVVNSGGVCVSAVGTYSKTESGSVVSTGAFNQFSGDYGSSLPTYDQGLNGARQMSIQGLGVQNVLIEQEAGSDMIFGTLASGIQFTGKVNGTTASITWMDNYNASDGIYVYSATTSSNGASGTIDVYSVANTSTKLASGLAASISPLPPISLNGSRVLRTVGEAYNPLPPASNVQVHNMTFTQISTALTGTDAGGTTSTGAFVSGWGPITSGSINPTTGEVTFSFEALVCGGGTSTITLSGITDGTTGSGIITFTAGPGACELPNGTWTLSDDSQVTKINVARQYTWVFQAGMTARATLSQTHGDPDDIISSATGTATIISNNYPMTVSGTLTNTDPNPTTKPVHLVFVSQVPGCGTLTVTADGTASETGMDFLWTSTATIAGSGCVNSTPITGYAVSP